jgi:hypothetical protein
MPMWLTRPTVLARVEERKQTLLLARPILPCFQASVRCLQIVLLQNMCLFLVGFGSEDEVFSNNWELVKHEEVAGVGFRYVSGLVSWQAMGRSAIVSASLLVWWRSVQASVVRKATGMPEEVRITASSVGENSKLDEAFADANLAFARLDSASGRPSSILTSMRVQ